MMTEEKREPQKYVKAVEIGSQWIEKSEQSCFIQALQLYKVDVIAIGLMQYAMAM